jgi:hypothetical protein
LDVKSYRLKTKLRLETITGDDTLIVEINMQYSNNYGSCTGASIVVVLKGFTNSTF